MGQWLAAGSVKINFGLGEPMREIPLSYKVDHSTISRLKVRYAAEI